MNKEQELIGLAIGHVYYDTGHYSSIELYNLIHEKVDEDGGEYTAQPDSTTLSEEYEDLWCINMIDVLSDLMFLLEKGMNIPKITYALSSCDDWRGLDSMHLLAASDSVDDILKYIEKEYNIQTTIEKLANQEVANLHMRKFYQGEEV